eukprot:365872-Chlamydomonas_euryale.AAC.7
MKPPRATGVACGCTGATKPGVEGRAGEVLAVVPESRRGVGGRAGEGAALDQAPAAGGANQVLAWWLTARPGHTRPTHTGRAGSPSLALPARQPRSGIASTMTAGGRC